jgi:hypothetical protein
MLETEQNTPILLPMSNMVQTAPADCGRFIGDEIAPSSLLVNEPVLKAEIPTPARLEFPFFGIPLDLIAGPEDCATEVSLLDEQERRHGASVLARILQDHVRRLLCDHYHGGVGIARYQIRHDGGINDPQSFDPAKAKPLIHHRERIVAHPAG